MPLPFSLESGRTVEIDVFESGNSVTVSQRFLNQDGSFLSKTCTVTCHETGKSYSWECRDDQMCIGDCSNPNNPRGRCG